MGCTFGQSAHLIAEGREDRWRAVFTLAGMEPAERNAVWLGSSELNGCHGQSFQSESQAASLSCYCGRRFGARMLAPARGCSSSSARFAIPQSPTMGAVQWDRLSRALSAAAPVGTPPLATPRHCAM